MVWGGSGWFGTVRGDWVGLGGGLLGWLGLVLGGLGRFEPKKKGLLAESIEKRLFSHADSEDIEEHYYFLQAKLKSMQDGR